MNEVRVDVHVRIAIIPAMEAASLSTSHELTAPARKANSGPSSANQVPSADHLV